MKKVSFLLLILLIISVSIAFSINLKEVTTLSGYKSVDYFNGKFIFGEKDGNVSIYNENFEKVGNYKISSYPITVVGATMGINGYILLFGDTTGKIYRYDSNFKYIGSLKPFNTQPWSIAEPKIPGIPRFVVGSLGGITIEFAPSELMGRPKKEGFTPVSINDLNLENSNSKSQIWGLEYVSNDMVLNTLTIDGILTSFAENNFSFRQIAQENIDTLGYCTTTLDDKSLVIVGGNGKIVEFKADFMGIEKWKKEKEIDINGTVFSMAHDSNNNIISGNSNGDLVIYNSNLDKTFEKNISNTSIWKIKVFNINSGEIIITIDNSGNVKVFKLKS